ncbi:DUF3131 domain-containing protein [Tabrizicola oligotrophica]|uniref:DUF3131 domain-containing protein n=1 Tax=Tabrizicola oligotrophica TaxID=2710650 RepID=A0A6M0QWH0_9RHOB|nr:DUF3131 domain-containing protein [Tabrizicola oligotrophica]NEY91747.1 DUF3131 domain-containing protein [Tabrizicola oligotrophica]
MRRRHFLELLAAGPFAANASLAQEIVPAPPQMVLLTIAGINAATSAEALGAVLSTLVVREVPVNLVVDTQDPSALVDSNSEIAQLLRRYSQSFAGLVEIVAWSPDLGRMTPYRAARKAHEARKALYAALFPGDVPARPVQTIACRAPLDSKAASAVLSAGFRCALELPASRPDFRATPLVMTARLDQFGLLSLLGGEVVPFSSAARALSRPTPDRQRHLVFAASDLAELSADRLTDAAQDIARLLDRAALDLSQSPVLTRDVQMRSEITFRRRIALHVLGPAGADAAGTEDAASAIFQLLTAQEIPFSRGPMPEGLAAPDKPDLSCWVPLDLPSSTDFGPDIPFGVFPAEPLGGPTPGAIRPEDTRFGIAVRLVGHAGNAGMTQQAGFGIPILALAGAAADDVAAGLKLDAEGDGVVLVIASSFRDAASRTALVAALRNALIQPDIRLMPLQVYCAETLPKEPLLPMLLLARAKVLQPASQPGPLAPNDRAAFLEDARAAWGYFEANTVARTGLCPATAVTAPGSDAGFLGVSMWEVGSHLNALIAAVDLGLLSDDAFSQRVDPILATVERESRKRLVLPPETIDAISGKGTTRFNSYDCGRLLIALHRLASHRLAPKGIAELVASWSFSEVIRNRRLHSYRDRMLIDDFRSNYAHYAVSGMRLWGLDVASPLDDIAKLGSADAEERLLALTSSFGLLAAEPSFLHLLELQDSPTSSFLADCVDSLQRRLANEIGQAVAPSESPLDKSPWFTYQGFDLRRLDDPWRVEFGAKSDDIRWNGKLESLKATSTKAAYLWHALRPNAHSLHLLRSLRAKARHDTGFDSAVYVASQTPTMGYSDLNTNAVILQSIAYMLRQL